MFAKNQGVNSPPDQLVFQEEDSFGVGNSVQTILYNKEGEVSSSSLATFLQERATHIQRSSTS